MTIQPVTVQWHLDRAAELRRDARLAYFAASGATPYHTECLAAAVAHERAAAALAREQNAVRFGQSLARFQKGA